MNNNNNVTNFSYGESKRKQILANFGIVDEFQKSITSNDMLEKGGKHGMIGEIRNGYKKIAEGKWKKVSEHGMTKKEHKMKSEEHIDKMHSSTGSNVAWNEKEHNKHADASNKLDDKEYDVTHVMGSERKENNKKLKQEGTHEQIDSDADDIAQDCVDEVDDDMTVGEMKEVVHEMVDDYVSGLGEKEKVFYQKAVNLKKLKQLTVDKLRGLHKSVEGDTLEKGLNTSHLTLKQVTDKNGKQTKRWVDANGKEHAEHGSHADFEHEGKKMSGKVGRVSSSGKYVMHGEDGTTYKKHHHEINPRAGGAPVTGNPTAKVYSTSYHLASPSL